MKTFEICCRTHEDYSTDYELAIGNSNADGSDYYLVTTITKISREDLEKFSIFLKKYLENN